jgi:hypothetical protein
MCDVYSSMVWPMPLLGKGNRGHWTEVLCSTAMCDVQQCSVLCSNAEIHRSIEALEHIIQEYDSDMSGCSHMTVRKRGAGKLAGSCDMS